MFSTLRVAKNDVPKIWMPGSCQILLFLFFCLQNSDTAILHNKVSVSQNCATLEVREVCPWVKSSNGEQ